jgi:CubicO group peptidase (beta-lactamase class C family)
MNPTPRRLTFFTFLLCLCLSLPSSSQTAAQPQNPSPDWQTLRPEDVGYSTPRLEALGAWLKTGPTSAMIVVVHGKIIFQYGNLAHASKIASIRKSILGMLYGNYVISGKIDLYKTVKQLGLDDVQPFLPIEEKATLEQLLAARSGIYLPSGNTNLDPLTPKRGSQYPGTFFDYNNWDFDAAGTAFEKLTGKNIFDALQTDLAQPLHMQDFDRSAQRSNSALPVSRHPEYAMYLSARDLARLGLLMLRLGSWDGKQVISKDWIWYMTSVKTRFEQMYPTPLREPGLPERWGYGAMWWVWDAPVYPGPTYAGPYQGAYTARGTGGQFVTVLPFSDMVIVHTVDIDKNPKAEVSGENESAIRNMVLASTCDGPCPKE